MLRQIRNSLLLAVALTALPSLVAFAQSWPTQPIKILVPVGTATPPDILSRAVAHELTQREGWTFVVENKVGAVHTLAVNELLRSPADGHTIFVSSAVFASAPALLRSVRFDPVKDLQPVVKISRTYNLLAVPPSSA